MKKNLLLGLALAAGVPAFAASPYQGSEAAPGSYYLYQVETGKWLQANMSQINNWTTHAELGNVGFDVELRKLDGFEGYQIYCFATNNGELNGSDQDRFYLDQGDRALCDWIFEPVEVEGVSNAYKIMIKAKPEARDRDRIGNNTYIGANPNADFGGLSDNPEYFTWQLVSKADRIAWMENEIANGPVDASWLIPAFDNGRNDNRHNRWTSTVTNNNGGGVAIDGKEGYPVQEYWHQVTMSKSYTITDLPTGTYKFTVQALYRDGSINDESDGYTAVGRRAEGLETIRASYFAGATKKPVKSIFDDAKTTQGGGFEFNCNDQEPGLALFVPNSMTDCSFAMMAGNYINEYIEVPVTDGSLTIGLEKPEATFRDWLIEKRYFLEYVSTTAGAEDLSGLQGDLEALIEEARELPSTPTLDSAIEEAETILEEATTSTQLQEAIAALNTAMAGVRNAANDIKAFLATKELGFTDAEAQAQFDTAVTRDDYAKALKTLRYARRVACAETEEHEFEGNVPAEGKFYLYNVGRKQFLQGGSDWGAHAALGMPGVELTFHADGQNSQGMDRFKIATGLFNGDGDYLNHRGYMDCVTNDNFAFIPVEGKPGVYYMVQGDYPRVFAMWDPYGSTDGGNNDETNVCTETRDNAEGVNAAEGNPNAMWMLVTKADRDALMEQANEEHPVDVSYYIKSPNVNQRERANEVWDRDGFVIWGDYGSNRNSFNFELWNNTGEVTQMIEGLPAGKYMVSCQGLFRNGTHRHGDEIDGSEPLQGQAYLPMKSGAYLYGGEDETNDVALPNILEESGMAPGEGADLKNEETGVVYHIPEYCDQIQNFVRYGLYKVQTVFEWNPESESDLMPIGVVVKEAGDEPGYWTVVDNFRLYYLGNEDQNETDGVEAIQPNEVVDGPIYNLQGIQVKEASAPGIYIQNGKKFVVTK